MWLGYGSDVARMWLGVFSDVADKVWQKLRERGFQHPPWNFIVILKRRKKGILESPIFIVVAFSQEYSGNTLGQLPPFHPPGGSD